MAWVWKAFEIVPVRYLTKAEECKVYAHFYVCVCAPDIDFAYRNGSSGTAYPHSADYAFLLQSKWPTKNEPTHISVWTQC